MPTAVKQGVSNFALGCGAGVCWRQMIAHGRVARFQARGACVVQDLVLRVAGLGFKFHQLPSCMYSLETTSQFSDSFAALAAKLVHL